MIEFFSKKKSGFTFIELAIVISVFAILLGISAVGFISLQKRAHLDRSVQEFTVVLRLARDKSIASDDNSQYGVYIDISAPQNQYTLFKGQNYTDRDQAYDKNYSLAPAVIFLATDLGGNEVSFGRLTGNASQSGSVTLQYSDDSSKITAIYISNSGAVGLDSLLEPSDDVRNKDSRHVHFDYSRTIVYNSDTFPCTGETINLYFDGSSSPQQQIPVCSNIKAGQIEWSGTVDVGGEPQTLVIRTHRLNSPDTQFSIHRDRRFNTKSFVIMISGDVSGALITYSADGLTVEYSSPNVLNPLWQ